MHRGSASRKAPIRSNRTTPVATLRRRSSLASTRPRPPTPLVTTRAGNNGPVYRITVSDPRNFVVKFSPVPSPKTSKENIEIVASPSKAVSTQLISTPEETQGLISAASYSVPGPSRVETENPFELINQREADDDVELWGLGTRIVDSIILVVGNRGPQTRRLSQGRQRRRRRRRVRTSARRRPPVQVEAVPSEESFYEVSDVTYEAITDVDGKEMPKNWRITPRYELTNKEIHQQETELYLSMTQEKRPEGAIPISAGDQACCICWENVATRVVIPCGHRCLCYPCAYNIATNRSIFGGSALPKLCPICQAAIGIIPRLVN